MSTKRIFHTLMPPLGCQPTNQMRTSSYLNRKKIEIRVLPGKTAATTESRYDYFGLNFRVQIKGNFCLHGSNISGGHNNKSKTL
jgi:hypothetical protein